MRHGASILDSLRLKLDRDQQPEGVLARIERLAKEQREREQQERERQQHQYYIGTIDHGRMIKSLFAGGPIVIIVINQPNQE